jgi:hypothetical protein
VKGKDLEGTVLDEIKVLSGHLLGGLQESRSLRFEESVTRMRVNSIAPALSQYHPHCALVIHVWSRKSKPGTESVSRGRHVFI